MDPYFALEKLLHVHHVSAHQTVAAPPLDNMDKELSCIIQSFIHLFCPDINRVAITLARVATAALKHDHIERSNDISIICNNHVFALWNNLILLEYSTLISSPGLIGVCLILNYFMHIVNKCNLLYH